MLFEFLIISDLHISTDEDFIIRQKESIINSIKNKCVGVKHLFILVAGDVAFSGTKEQYCLAEIFFKDITAFLKDYCRIGITILFSPGNHDCDFKKPNSVRDVLIKNVLENSKNIVTDDILDVCCSVQENFFSFTQLFTNENCTEIFRHKLLNIYTFEIENVKFKFFLYNMAWLSQRVESYGEIVFPIQNFEKDKFISENEINISILHHPFNWQAKDSYHEIKDHILKTSSLVITGHEHHADSMKVISAKMGETVIIESGVAQGNINESNFSLLNMDTSSKSLNINEYNFSENEYQIAREDRIEFDIDKKSNNSFIAIKKEFLNLLNDPGANFSHPRKDNLVLCDFFIDPNFQEIEYKSIIEKVEKKRNIINSSAIDIKTNSKIIILGNEKSGKTAFLQMKYISYYNNGLIPILLNGDELNSNSIEDIKKVIIKKYCNQYDIGKKNIESGIDFKKTVLLIDNFETTNTNKEYRNKLLSTIDKYFEYIVITTNDLFFFEEKLLSNIANVYINNFKYFEIIRFGNFLRRSLIKKWILINREFTSQFEEQKELNTFCDTINRIIGKNLVPSTPFYILTIIQSLEAGKPNDLQHSSYGYCYEYLIVKSFANASISAKEMDAFYNVLSCLAHEMFIRKESEISESKLKSFYDEHKNKYDVNMEYSYIVNKLLRTSIISLYNDIYHFKYKYLFYYFVAKYISLNISEESIRLEITNITMHINREENSNILMFLMHLSRDNFIIDKILEAAKLDFCKNEEVELDEDVDILNSLLEEVPERVLEQIDSVDITEERLKELDKISGEDQNSPEVDPDGEIEYTSEDSEDLLELSTQLNTSFKTIELLGQIIKCYYGSLKAETKYEIADEAFSITLRTLNCYFSLLRDNLNNILKELVEYFDEKKISDRDKILKQSRAFIFHLALIIAISFMKRTSCSIGSEDLELTYDRIIEKKGSIARQLLSMSIKLQHSRIIPEAEIIELDKYTRKKNLPNLLLKDLVLDFMYMFDVPLPTRQRICDKIGIAYKLKTELDFKKRR